jgi:deazaflavin-dependent oxidoreductase (nitroreductase family)
MARPPAAAAWFNRVAVRLAGRRWFPLWAVLHHRGRRSGTEYATPVAIVATPGHVVIALAWGREADWVRNTLAAGGCTLRWKGAEHRCTHAELVGAEALAGANPLLRRILERRPPADGFIRLRRPTGP